MILSFGLFFIAFILLWVGSGLAVRAVTKISYSLHMSSFFVSFFVLGFFTSLTEIMVGINAIINQTPEIFVGNLIGSSVVVFLLVVPLLAVLGNGVSLNHSFTFKDLVTAALVVGLPALLTLDNRINLVDALVCIIVYIYFLYIQEKNNSSLSKLVSVNLTSSTIYTNLFKIIFAVILVFIASNILVEQTSTLGTFLGVSPYIISILIISIGTNVPELSIAARAVIAQKKNVAFGNYVGSASLNTILMGIFSIFSQRPIAALGSNFSILAFLFGILAFLFFGKSKREISRNEGLALLITYTLFVIFELVTGPGWVFN